MVDGDLPDLPLPRRSKMNFKHVAGLNSLKEVLRTEVIYPISHRELAKLYRQTVGSGVLLYGPPGCGKTHIVKALAGEIGWPIIDASCGHMIARYAGQTENNIHCIFDRAREYAKYRNGGIILFLDEIDALGHRRDNMGAGEAGYRMTVTTLLSELDGISSNDQVFVVGATNSPWSVDPALKRPGRFDECIFVPPPDLETRFQLLKLYSQGLPLSDKIDFNVLAEKTQGYSSVDIRELCDAAAEIPWKEAIKTNNTRSLCMSDFEGAMQNKPSSLTEWYHAVEKNNMDPSTRKLFPSLSDSVKEFLCEKPQSQKQDLRGYQ